MTEKSQGLPNAFIWRRLHSFTGFWLVLFLIEHLLTNSQAALFFGNDGNGFVNAVNAIHSLPYLEAIELFLLGVPLLIHMVWGVLYLRTAKLNSSKSDGSTPSLGEYSRNRAYSWQRITAWLLLIGIIAHVIQMRFIEYPVSAGAGDSQVFMVRLKLDQGLYTVADRLNVQLFDSAGIDREENLVHQAQKKLVQEQQNEPMQGSSAIGDELRQTQAVQQQELRLAALKKRPLDKGEVIAVARNFGTASLLVVRDTFKNPLFVSLYTFFVLAAAYHAFNGLWTFLISWGVILTQRSQKIMLKLSTGLMVLIAFFGLVAIWGTYWINLKH